MKNINKEIKWPRGNKTRAALPTSRRPADAPQAKLSMGGFARGRPPGGHEGALMAPALEKRAAAHPDHRFQSKKIRNVGAWGVGVYIANQN